MTPTLIPPETTTSRPGYDVRLPDQVFPYDNDETMDSPWHRAQIELLIAILEFVWKGVRFYCGGNMFVHFSPTRARNKDFRGPDFFVVLDVDHDKPRLYWATWDEDSRTPDFILELLSPSTAREDREVKKPIYEKTLKTHELVYYDPDEQTLEGWRLAGEYQPITPDGGRVWLEKLGLGIGPWRGTWDGQEAVWLRFFDRDGKMLPTPEEALSARLESEVVRAEAEATRANAEAARANKAETDAARLQKELDALRQQVGHTKTNGNT